MDRVDVEYPRAGLTKIRPMTETDEELAAMIREAQATVRKCCAELKARDYKIFARINNDGDYIDRDRSYDPTNPYLFTIRREKVVREEKSL